jgi:hypothetical protein
VKIVPLELTCLEHFDKGVQASRKRSATLGGAKIEIHFGVACVALKIGDQVLVNDLGGAFIWHALQNDGYNRKWFRNAAEEGLSHGVPHIL